VAFRDGSDEHTLEFDFKAGLWDSRRAAEARASEWLATLARAAAAITGVAPTTEAADNALARVYPDAGTLRLWNALALMFYGLVLLLLLGGRTETFLMAIVLVAGALVGGRLLLATRRRTLRLRPGLATGARAADSPAGVPGFDPARDFILCPPRLPRMAKAIIVYLLVAVPRCGWWGSSPSRSIPLFRKMNWPRSRRLRSACSSPGRPDADALAGCGGWKLRALRPSAPVWVKTGLWLHLAWAAVTLVAIFLVEDLMEKLGSSGPLERILPGEALLAALGVAAFVFEISGLVWLSRHAALLASLCRLTAVPQGPHGTRVLPTAPAFSLKAVWGAVLAGLALLLVGGPLALAILGGGGLGPREFLLLGCPVA